jgi:hypothetical protein
MLVFQLSAHSLLVSMQAGQIMSQAIAMSYLECLWYAGAHIQSMDYS